MRLPRRLRRRDSPTPANPAALSAIRLRSSLVDCFSRVARTSSIAYQSLSRTPRNPSVSPESGAQEPWSEPTVDLSCQAMWRRRSLWWRGAVDLLLYSSVLALLAVVEYGYVPSPRTGFYCHDPKIDFKFNGDTITVTILLIGTFLFPFFVIWAVESSMAYLELADSMGGSWSSYARRGAVYTVRWYREYVLGIGVVMFVTDAMKLLISEPRPHFLDTCRPDTAANCTSPTQWIDDFRCTNLNDPVWDVRDSMRSFPSGHTSISVFTAIFIMVFLRRRMARDVTHLLVPWLQGLFTLWALTCSLTRITDHRHHWWDVLAGSIVGTICAAYSIRVFCHGFHPRRRQNGEDSLTSSPVAGPKGLQNNLPTRPLLNGHTDATDIGVGERATDVVPERRLLSSSSSCASSTAEERELREVSTT